jgi:hypothetical protein
MTKRVLYPLIAIGVILLLSLSNLNAQQSSGEEILIGGDDIGGVVTSTGRLGDRGNVRPASKIRENCRY